MDTRLVSVDANFLLYARCDRESDIFVRGFADDVTVARFELAGARVWYLRLSSNGRMLLAEHAKPGKHSGDLLSVWSVDSRVKIWELPHGISHYAADFSPDCSLVVAADADDAVLIYDLARGKQLQRFTQGASPYSDPPSSLSLWVASLGVSIFAGVFAASVPKWKLWSGLRVVLVNTDGKTASEARIFLRRM